MPPKSPVGAFGRTILKDLFFSFAAGVMFCWHSRYAEPDRLAHCRLLCDGDEVSFVAAQPASVAMANGNTKSILEVMDPSRTRQYKDPPATSRLAAHSAPTRHDVLPACPVT